jgi:hypothetical protein
MRGQVRADRAQRRMGGLKPADTVARPEVGDAKVSTVLHAVYMRLYRLQVLLGVRCNVGIGTRS